MARAVPGFRRIRGVVTPCCPRLDRLREHGVEFSLLTDAFEDSGAGLVQLAQIV